MIPVFYRPEMVAASNVSDSPSAGKPQQVVEDWTSNRSIAQRLVIRSFDPVTTDMIKAVHDPVFVDGVLGCTVANGFDNLNPDVAASLPYTSGSLLAAAHEVLQRGGVAVSPTSGFHHAEYNRAMGFCTFNGLMITAVEVLKRLPNDSRILILDFDMHYGNGTDDIIKRLGLTARVHHITNGNGYRTIDQAMAICDPRNLMEMLDTQRYDLVIYQAGADIHRNDPYGGLMTTEQMIERDRGIFQSCAGVGTPLVWNLAGGYQRDAAGRIEPVLTLHRNTVLECIAAY